MPDTISEAQVRPLFAIGLATGYYRPAIHRLIKQCGYDAPDEIRRRTPAESTTADYDQIVEMLRDEELAFRYNRDPDTPDLFDDAQPTSTNR